MLACLRLSLPLERGADPPPSPQGQETFCWRAPLRSGSGCRPRSSGAGSAQRLGELLDVIEVVAQQQVRQVLDALPAALGVLHVAAPVRLSQAPQEFRR